MHVRADVSTHQMYFTQLVSSNVPMRKLDGQGDCRLIPGGRDYGGRDYGGRDYAGRGYRGGADVQDLRRSDLNRDGVVTLAEALQEGRYEFRSSDRDRNRVLTRREVSWGEFAQDDRDRNGVVSYGEHQDSIRRAFHRFDSNRDGVLARYELGQPGARGAGWRR